MQSTDAQENEISTVSLLAGVTRILTVMVPPLDAASGMAILSAFMRVSCFGVLLSSSKRCEGESESESAM